MEKNMVLIMVDECGEEVEVNRWAKPDFNGDEDALDIWKERKVMRASEDYPEARGFYWEDRSSWHTFVGLNWDFVDEFLYGAP